MFAGKSDVDVNVSPYNAILTMKRLILNADAVVRNHIISPLSSVLST